MPGSCRGQLNGSTEADVDRLREVSRPLVSTPVARTAPLITLSPEVTTDVPNTHLIWLPYQEFINKYLLKILKSILSIAVVKLLIRTH